MDNDIAQRARDIFAKNFEYHMKLEHKSQMDIANHLGVSASTVSDWANGKKYPRVDKMQRIADYLGVLISDLREERNTGALLLQGKRDPVLESIVEKLTRMDDRQLQMTGKFVASIMDEE